MVEDKTPFSLKKLITFQFSRAMVAGKGACPTKVVFVKKGTPAVNVAYINDIAAPEHRKNKA